MLNNIGLPGLILLLYPIGVLGMSLYAVFNVPAKDEDYSYAGFWMRAIAVLIDAIIVAVITFPAAYVLGYGLGYQMAQSGASAGEIQSAGEAMGNVLGIFITWIYFAALESSKLQGTIGKRALSLKVVDSEGNRIGFGRATGRHFAKIISGILLLVGYFMAGWTKRKRALHDIIAGTLVVKVSS